MTGRSSRSAGRSRATPQEPIEDSQTQSATQESSQDGQQGVGVGVDSNLGSTIVIPHNDGVDVRAPMSLAQMRQIVNNEILSTEQLQILGDRIRELAEIHDGTFHKRTRDETDSDSDNDRSQKRRADHDLKYDTIKELKLGATLKQWTNWRLEINRAFDGAPYKYDNDRGKVIKALMHLHEDCKTLWNNHLRRHPSEEYDW